MESKPMRWCEISDSSEKVRFEALSAAMKSSGHENSVEFFTVTKDDFGAQLAAVEREFDGIRLSGNASEWIFQQTERMPSLTATLNTADALAREETKEGIRWWSRAYLLDGLNRTLAASKTTPDISGAVFILGARPITRVLIASLARIGFSRFNIVDPDETKAQEFCENLKKRLFGLDVHSVARHYMTQLPGIHSFAANVLEHGKDDGTIQELFYFNFLKPNGLWLDLPLSPFNQALEAEAVAVGASILDSSSVLSQTDALWLNECFGVEISPQTLKEKFDQSRQSV
ncbi:MAG TPA: hypothetical protein VM432_02100 [Bdellovibrionales bacterium]|nr:hypothetical protein [Bdellovibrionales bacterium]